MKLSAIARRHERMELTHGSLFSGIGGFDLAFERAGFKSIWQVEIDDYATKVLEKNFPGVQRFRDIRTVHGVMAHSNAGRRKESEIQAGGNTTSDGCAKCLPTPTVLTGGFPCQPFSVAGKQRGKADDRYLWPEMLRVIDEVRPRFVLAENVRGIVKMALDQVLSDLEAIGYTTGAIIIPACAVDAPHRRDRVWIMGYTTSSRCGTGSSNQQGRQVLQAPVGTIEENQSEGNGRQLRVSAGSGDEDVANAGQQPARNQGEGFDSQSVNGAAKEIGATEGNRFADGSWWLPEPNVGRVAHGVPNRVDRLKCLGNAIVPQIAEEIAWQIRKVIEL